MDQNMRKLTLSWKNELWYKGEKFNISMENRPKCEKNWLGGRNQLSYRNQL